MNKLLSTSAVLAVVATTAACVDPLPPPPALTVTSPQRGTVQGKAGQITVTGTAMPGPSGAAVSLVWVDGAQATLGADGSFTATVDAPAGLDLIRTEAIASDGGRARDTRAVQAGQLTPVGTAIPKAVTVALSSDVFAKLSAAAGPFIMSMDMGAALAPIQPMVSLGDSTANLQLSITQLGVTNAKVALTPVANGLQLSVELDGLDFGARAVAGGSLVPGASTDISVTADQVMIAGTLEIAAGGSGSFTTSIAAANVSTTNLQLHATGLVGQLLNLLTGSLASTITTVATGAAQSALGPLIGGALGGLGTLAGPQHVSVLGHDFAIQASPSAVAFTPSGASVTVDLGLAIGGSESSPGYVSTQHGTPTLTATSGIQLALADDLVNEISAEMLATGALDVQLHGNYDVFDNAKLQPLLPPMIGAGSADGLVRLTIGDLMATLTDNGQPFATAAVNAQVDVQVAAGSASQQIALQFGNIDLAVDVIDAPADLGGVDLDSALGAGINLQLSSMQQFLVDVPLPSMIGLTLGDLSLRGDSGNMVVSGSIQ